MISKIVATVLTNLENQNLLGKQNFVAYPNPVKSDYQLNISSNDGLPFDIFLVDMNGKIVHSQFSIKEKTVKYNYKI